MMILGPCHRVLEDKDDRVTPQKHLLDVTISVDGLGLLLAYKEISNELNTELLR